MPKIDRIPATEVHTGIARFRVGETAFYENWLAGTTTPVTITGFGTYAHAFVTIAGTGEVIDEPLPLEALNTVIDDRLSIEPHTIPLG
jgi:hypothetical protein